MLKIYNTLSREVEDFEPINPSNVGMYACGPTVYDYQHIGNMRRYVGDDILVRILNFDGYKVKHIMNITDVGHLTSDADEGEDKIEKGARTFNISVWDLVKKLEKHFFEQWDLLNIQRPSVLMHATDFIKDQIDLIKVLEEKGFTYKTEDGIYFDTSKFPGYNRLSRQDLSNIKPGVRIELKDKKHVTDFALWKFSYPGGRSFDSAQDDSASRRQMEWSSPWGKGFPGWHLECSAMSMRELGVNFDIHTGGIDHISVHHTNEIAQSEAASGRHFVNYWVHHGWLFVNGQKMSKSLGNIYTVQDIVKKGYNPLALRYLYLQTHYRMEMNFTWASLDAAQKALDRLFGEIRKMGKPADRINEEFGNNFFNAINDDLNIPQALAIIWELIKSKETPAKKIKTLFEFDKILGLNLEKTHGEKIKQKIEIPQEVLDLVKQREELRKEKRFHLADQIRNKIKKLGYEIEDKDKETEINPLDKK